MPPRRKKQKVQAATAAGEAVTADAKSVEKAMEVQNEAEPLEPTEDVEMQEPSGEEEKQEVSVPPPSPPAAQPEPAAAAPAAAQFSAQPADVPAPNATAATPSRRQLVLEDHLWMYIFRFLDFTNLIGTVSRVCKYFYICQLEKEAISSVNLYHVRGCVRDEFLIKYFTRWGYLESLDLTECSNLSLSTLAALLQHTPRLRKLVLVGHTSLPDQIAHSFATLSNLMYLDLTCCMGLTNIGVKTIISYSTRLQTLILWGCSALGDEAMMTVHKLKDLKAVDLTWCSSFTDTTYGFLSECEKLSMVNLMWCERVKDSSLKLLSKTRLTYLNIDGCSRISDNGMKTLAVCYPFLRTLSARFSTRITISGIQEIVRGCPSLDQLDIRNCALIQENAVEAVTSNRRTKRLTIYV